MYEQFIASFPLDSAEAGSSYDDSPLAEVDGFPELVSLGGGISFGGGVIRIHDKGSGRRARKLVLEAFPEYGPRVFPFAQDWMGRQFAVRFRDSASLQGEVLLFELGSGEAFAVDCGLRELFEVELVDDPVGYLSVDLFEEWRQAGYPAPGVHECVGYKVPLFLGGHGEVENLELSDIEVYWSLLGQMRLATKDLPSGIRISDVNLADPS